MNPNPSQKRVTTTAELEALIGVPSELVIKKRLSQLDDHMTGFIAQSPLMLLGTTGRDGGCDVSPRGDPPPVARVLDACTLVIAERPGNRLADSLRNIIETGKIGLLFLVPGIGESLRVNGRAWVTRDDATLVALATDGKRPRVAIEVAVEECYFQCAKALIRAKLWQYHPTPPDATSRHFAQILIDQTQVDGETVDSLEQQIQQSYRDRLY